LLDEEKRLQKEIGLRLKISTFFLLAKWFEAIGPNWQRQDCVQTSKGLFLMPGIRGFHSLDALKPEIYVNIVENLFTTNVEIHVLSPQQR